MALRGVLPPTGFRMACQQPLDHSAALALAHLRLQRGAVTNVANSARSCPLASANAPSSSAGALRRLTQNVGYPNALAPAVSQPAKEAKSISPRSSLKASSAMR